MDFLVVSNVLLWIGFLAMVLVNLALARQIGVLYERVAPAGALMMNQKLTVGSAAPELAVTTLAGDVRQVGKVEGDVAAQHAIGGHPAVRKGRPGACLVVWTVDPRSLRLAQGMHTTPARKAQTCDVLKNQDEGVSSFSASAGPRRAPGPPKNDSG